MSIFRESAIMVGDVRRAVHRGYFNWRNLPDLKMVTQKNIDFKGRATWKTHIFQSSGTIDIPTVFLDDEVIK